MQELLINDDTSLQEFNAALKEKELSINKVTKFDEIQVTDKLNTPYKIIVSPQYISKIHYDLAPLQKLVYGKCPQENIVNISYKDDTIHVFAQELNNNNIAEYKIPYNHYSIHSTPQFDALRLKGSTPYKYYKEYANLDKFLNAKKDLYKYKEFFIANPVEAFMVRDGFTYYKGMKPSNLSILSFDIETNGLDPYRDDALVFMVSYTFRQNEVETTGTFILENYADQFQMLEAFCAKVRELNPSVILGFNIVMFDIPFMNTILTKNGLPGLQLGRDGSSISIEDRTREIRKDGSQSYSFHRIEIFGRDIIDMFFVSLKYDIGRKYESYRLKSIIEHEGLEEANRQHYDASNIRTHWYIPEEREKIIKYAEADSRDPIKLFNIMIPSLFYSTQMIPKTAQYMTESATGSQLNSVMIRSYLQDGYTIAKANEKAEFEGAISLGIPGIYRNAKKWDVASLYPSIIVQYEIEDKLKDFNGNFLKFVSYLRIERLKNKKIAQTTGDKYYNDLQEAQKISINSLYGFLGASNLNYNSPKGASDITRYGREILTKAIKWATGNDLECYTEDKPKSKGGQNLLLINCDTDSLTVCKSDMTEFTAEESESLYTELNSLYPENIKWEDDGYFPFFTVLKAKNYIMFDGKKIKTKGSGIKDQKKEPALREMLDNIVKDLIATNGANAAQIYIDCVKEAAKPTNIKRWCAKKTITKAVLECKNSDDVRGNELSIWNAIKDVDVQEGDKVYLYPAILGENVIETQLKNGKIKTKVEQITGLRHVDQWDGKDHNMLKLVSRVNDSVQIFANILDMNLFPDYSLKRNLDALNRL